MKRFLSLGLILMVLISCGLGDKAKQIKGMADNLEEAAKSLEEGDTTAAEDAFGKLLGGGEKVQPVNFRTLRDLLPENLSGLPRTNASGEKSGMMGMSTSKAEGQYQSEDGQQRINVTITDMGSIRGLGMLGVNWLMVEIDQESDTGYERTTKYRGYPAYEKFQQRGNSSNGEMSAYVADRFMVNVSGRGVDMDAVKEAMEDLDIRKLEALKDEGVGEDAENADEVAEYLRDAQRQAERMGARNDNEAERDDADPQTLGDALNAANGNVDVDPVDFRELKTFLPESLSDLPRTNSEGEKGGAMGVIMSSATGTYESEDNNRARVTIKITDMGTLQGAMMLGNAWLMTEIDKESDTSYERTTRYEGNPAYEKFDRRGERTSGKMQTVVGKRFLVEVEGRDVEMEVIKKAMDQLDLNRLDSMKEVGITPAS